MSQETRDLNLRRAPKYLPFILFGGAAGVIVGLILFFATGQLASKDWASMLGLLIVGPAAIGAGVGVVSASILDGRSVAKSRQVQAAKLDE
jgi:hypothetical protein